MASFKRLGFKKLTVSNIALLLMSKTLKWLRAQVSPFGGVRGRKSLIFFNKKETQAAMSFHLKSYVLVILKYILFCKNLKI